MFHESDIEKITGLNLFALKWTLADFLATMKSQPDIPGSDSLAGEWIFGIKPRYPDDRTYISLEQSKEEIARRDPKTERYFYRDAHFVWDFKQLQLGRWDFILETDQIRGGIFVSYRQKNGHSVQVFLRVTITAGEKFVVKDWKIEESSPILPLF